MIIPFSIAPKRLAGFTRSFLLICLVTLVLVSFSKESSVNAETPAADDQAALILIGAKSCATSTCHGGTQPNGPIWNRSLSIHRSRDPHATAGLILLDEDSAKIVARLDPESLESDVAYDNVLRTRCLSCHATVTPDQCEPIGAISQVVLGNGVSCESCHGAASDWVDQHYKTSWASSSRRQASSFRETESILERSQNCVRCHVGSRSADGLVRDVNHDLIAAGHPALRFDLLIYHQNMPKHWDPNQRSEREFDASSIRVRDVGRATGLAAAAMLTAERATDHLRDVRSVPWPELADYDCFACHQALSMGSYNLPASDVSRSPLHVSDGLPVWNAWFSISQLDLRDAPDYLLSLSPQQSDPSKLGIAGRKVAKHFRAMAATAATEPTSPTAALGEITDMLRRRPPVDWHEAAVAYLQIEAVIEDLSRRPGNSVGMSKLAEQLPQLASLLRFDSNLQAGTQSRSNDSWRADSPVKFDATVFRREALSMFQMMPDSPTTKP